MVTEQHPSSTAPEQADIIVRNGRIATQDDRRSFASAVAIKDGRFLAVGTDTEVMSHKGAATQVIDVGGDRHSSTKRRQFMSPIIVGFASQPTFDLSW